MISRRSFLVTSAAGASCVPAAPAHSQSTAPLRIVVGFAPGGAADFVARQLSSQLQLEGVSAVIIDNRPGAGGRIAVEAVKAAAPDGRTLLLTPGSILSIYPHVYNKLTYDPLRDLAPVTPLASVPYSVSVGPLVSPDVKTLRDFGLWLQAHPGMASYGSPGGGTTPHFVGVMLAKALGVNTYQHVPYRGGAPAIQDVIAGQIASSINVVSEVVPFARSRKARVLAVSSPQRLPQLPDVPTFEQAGFENLTSKEWFGLFAPANTSAERVASISQAARRAFSLPTVQKALEDMAFNGEGSTPAEFGARLKRDLAYWAPVVQSTGFKVDD